MRAWLMATLGAAVTLASASHAQVQGKQLLQNPYADIATTLARHPPAAARLEITASDTLGRSPASSTTVALADAWAAATDARETRVFDFVMNRHFLVRGQTVESSNPAALAAFRVLEFQNRAVLQGVVGAATKGNSKGADASLHPCQAANELGVALPIQGYTADAKIEQAPNGGRLICDGREFGRYELSEHTAPPTFWPYFANTFGGHPELVRAMKRSGRLPRLVTVQLGLGRNPTRTWTLSGINEAPIPYPIASRLTVVGGSSLPETVQPRLEPLARSALAETAAGGPPGSVGDWDARVKRAAETGGAAAAYLEAMAGSHLFPMEQGCLPADAETCRQLAATRKIEEKEPVVAAFFSIVRAEQTGELEGAVNALASLKPSAVYDFPVLGASYALALHKMREPAITAAKAKSLPVDPIELHVRAIEAYPYSPAYWSDLGDYFLLNWDMASAYYCFDVAANLPVPSTSEVALSAVVRGKRQFILRLLKDFPEFFGP